MLILHDHVKNKKHALCGDEHLMKKITQNYVLSAVTSADW